MKIKIPYWQLIAVPVLLIGIGTASNQAVLIANHDKFPVMVNSRKIAEKQAEASLQEKIASLGLEMPKHGASNSEAGTQAANDDDQFLDDVHSIMGPNSRLKALADIFDVGYGIASVGDFAIDFGYWLLNYTPIIWLTLLIRKFNSL